MKCHHFEAMEKNIFEKLIFENLKISKFFLLQNDGTSLMAIFTSFWYMAMILGANESWIFILWDGKVFYPPFLLVHWHHKNDNFVLIVRYPHYIEGVKNFSFFGRVDFQILPEEKSWKTKQLTIVLCSRWSNPPHPPRIEHFCIDFEAS